METFRIKSPEWHIQNSLFTAAVICIFGINFFINFIPIDNPYKELFFVLIILGIAFWAIRYLVVSTTEIILSDEELRIFNLFEFIKYYKYDQTIQLKEIQEYSYKQDGTTEKLKLKTTNGNVIEITHNTNNNNDDFKKFIDIFISKVDDYNYRNTNHYIKRKNNIYDTKINIVEATIIGILLIIFTISFSYSPPKSPMNWVILALAYAQAFYYLFRVFQARRKRKNNLSTSA